MEKKMDLNEFKLTILALILSLLGISSLFFISEIKFRDLSKKGMLLNLDKDMVDENVVIEGKIKDIINTGKTLILEIIAQNEETQNTLSVIIFKDSNLDLKTGDYIRVYGTVLEYNGVFEIIADQIKII